MLRLQGSVFKPELCQNHRHRQTYKCKATFNCISTCLHFSLCMLVQKLSGWPTKFWFSTCTVLLFPVLSLPVLEALLTLWEEEGGNGRPLLLIDGVWNPTVVQLLSGYFCTSCFILCQVYLKVMLFLQQSPCTQDTWGKVPLPSACERRSLSSECSWSLWKLSSFTGPLRKALRVL